jgi:hypothetical protein
MMTAIIFSVFDEDSAENIVKWAELRAFDFTDWQPHVKVYTAFFL